MGLDMFLYERRQFRGTARDPKISELYEAVFNEVIPDSDTTVLTFESEVIYWRKANYIHDWFVKNVQGGEDDCGKYEVTQEQLKSLRDTCCSVSEDHTLADKLLPTSSGFFFGSTEYDERYFGEIERTIHILDDILADCMVDKIKAGYTNKTFVYQSSW